MTKAELINLKNQLAQMKEDLDRFVARKPTGVVIAPLRERIRHTEIQIADAERRQAEDRRSSDDTAADGANDSAEFRSSPGRISPRRR